ncbi:hypothetical protein GS444_10320 [Rhodococcus hoagii]|nr:hypothetical protein [Prescottella equi]
MHDLVIRGGFVVDGTGEPPRAADVAVDDGRISIVGDVPDAGRREIDAAGKSSPRDSSTSTRTTTDRSPGTRC